jgi:hypothetical protein
MIREKHFNEFVGNLQRSVYGGLHGLFPEGFCIDKDLEEHSGKLAVLSSLLQHLNSVQSAKPEKIVVVSNHTKVYLLFYYCCCYRCFSLYNVFKSILTETIPGKPSEVKNTTVNILLDSQVLSIKEGTQYS